MTLLKELAKYKNRKVVKKYYFMWKHKIRNRYSDYSNYSKEEFIEKFCEGSQIRFNYLEAWEKSEDYQRLLNIMLQERMGLDMYDMYQVVNAAV